MKSVLEFLTALNRNNNRDWFHSNKEWHEKCRAKMLFMTEVFISEIRKFDDEIPFMDPGECLFRIYRDTRFSADKSPYKTYFGTYMAKGGRKSTLAGYYFHVQPGECFVGGGIWMPEAPVLKAIRTAIFDHSEEYLAIVNDPGFSRYFKEVDGEKLKTAPKGFPSDFPYIDLLRYKSYAFGFRMADDVVTGDGVVGAVVDAFRELYKMNRFLNDALDKYLEN